MLKKGAVRENLPPVARGADLLEFKMAPHVKTGSNTSCYKQSLLISSQALYILNVKKIENESSMKDL